MLDASSIPPPPPGFHKHAMVIITYVACASFHASREAYVAVKGDFQRRLHFPTQLLGILDTTFLVTYGVGLLFSGSVGARYGNKNAAIVGLAGTAAVIAIFGALSEGWLCPLPCDETDAWTQGVALYVPLWALNGLVQSLGFPNLVAVTSGWVDPSQRGLVLGLWSTTGAAGDIVGLNVATFVLEAANRRAGAGASASADLGGDATNAAGEDFAHPGGRRWTDVFFVVAAYLAVMTLILGFGVPDRRAEARGAEDAENAEDAPGEDAPLLKKPSDEADKTRSSSSFSGVFTGLMEAWQVPGVLDWSASYFFIKTVTYTILFWMPYYLTLTLDSQAVADNLTVLFDVSMIAGTTCLGFLSDHIGGTRSPLFVLSFAVGSLPLLFLPALETSTAHYAVAFGVVGFLSGGPAHMYGTAVSVDLGETAALMGKPGLVSSLSGLIDGIGTLGAAVGQTVVARVASDGEKSRDRVVLANSYVDSRGRVVDPSVLDGTYVSRGDIDDDEANGFTDAKFDMPEGLTIDSDGMLRPEDVTRRKRDARGAEEDEEAAEGAERSAGERLYAETEAHHAGAQKRGLADLISELAADVAGQTSSGALGAEGAVGGLSARVVGGVPSSALYYSSSDGGGAAEGWWFGGGASDAFGGGAENTPVSVALGAILDSSGSGGSGDAGADIVVETEAVDADFQRRWARVFFMLFAFNLLAAGTLLRVAAWEMRRVWGKRRADGGREGGAEDAEKKAEKEV